MYASAAFLALLASVCVVTASPLVEYRRSSTGSPQFLTAKTKKFAVDGKNLPDVPFDIGESYSGLLPISSAANETRELFFWFFPSTNPAASKEVTMWFNGGPGCTSLEGLLQENGPFQWQTGTYAPVQNPYSWNNLTNMLYIEQPVGVGFSQGTPDIADEKGLAKQLLGFYKNFVDTFDVQNHKVYLTGESYAGYYIPYIADAMVAARNKKYYNLQGMLIYDPIIGDGGVQSIAPMLSYINHWAPMLSLNATFLKEIKHRADVCNVTSYQSTYLKFPPPKGPFPTFPQSVYDDPLCQLQNPILEAAYLVNPCFNVYHISDTCPFAWDVMGDNPAPASAPQAYFNRTDVQAALHVPPTNWAECTNNNVFTGPQGDTSDSPAQAGVLQRVVEAVNNTIIAVGLLDFLLPSDGTLLVLQNLTWHGLQGFQHPPTQELFVPYHPDPNMLALSGAGVAGHYAQERGLTFATVNLAGHMVPKYAPGAAYRMVEVMLRRVKNLGVVRDFTTQSGNFTGTTPVR